MEKTLALEFASIEGLKQYYQIRIKEADSQEALQLIRKSLAATLLNIKINEQKHTEDELRARVAAIATLNAFIDQRFRHVPEKNDVIASELLAQGILVGTASVLFMSAILSFGIPSLALISGYLVISLAVAFNIKTLIENYNSIDFTSLKAMVNNPNNVKLFLSLAASCELLFYTFGEALLSTAIAISSVTILFSVLSLISSYKVYQRHQALKIEQATLNQKFATLEQEVIETCDEKAPLIAEFKTPEAFGIILRTTDLTTLSKEHRKVLALALTTITTTSSIEMSETCLAKIKTILGNQHPDLYTLIELKTQLLYTDKTSIGELQHRVIADTSLIVMGMALHLALFIPGVSAAHFLFIVLYGVGTIGMSLFIYNEFKDMRQYNSAFKSGMSITSTSVTAMFACILWTTVLGSTFALNPFFIVPALLILVGAAYMYQHQAKVTQAAQIEIAFEQKLATMNSKDSLHPGEGIDSKRSDSMESEKTQPLTNSGRTTRESSISQQRDDDDEGESEHLEI